MLILQALEGPLADPVVTRRPDASPDMTQLGMGGDEVLEAERPEGAAVVGDQRDGDDLTRAGVGQVIDELGAVEQDRKSTRLNSSHVAMSYAVFCLEKINKTCDS